MLNPRLACVPASLFGERRRSGANPAGGDMLANADAVANLAVSDLEKGVKCEHYDDLLNLTDV